MKNSDNNEMYTALIDSIKAVVSEKKMLQSSKEYKIGKSFCRKKSILTKFRFSDIKDEVTRYLKFRNGKNYSMANPLINKRNFGASNYFSDDRIAIYTCITGGYDEIEEPLFVPDNCDFFAITDFELPAESTWKRIDVDSLNYAAELMNSPALINRYFKMFPYKVFPEYKYSVYVDGNIRICTDMTEYINRISDIGVGTFCHAQRVCVYEEAKACVAMGKASKESIERHLRHLNEEGMPRNYGMAQCSVIARKHDSAVCIKLMEDWWQEYLNYAKRDQLSLPFVMYKNGLKMEQITTLGSNVYRSNSFEIKGHRN